MRPTVPVPAPSPPRPRLVPAVSNDTNVSSVPA
jgi:hypothetical protein